MLTDDEVKKIQVLKERGYSMAKGAKTLGLARGTVAKEWGGSGERVSLAHLKRRFDECFKWETCEGCGLMYWAPKFLPTWRCPGCKTSYSWREPQFTENSRVGQDSVEH